MRWYFSHYQKYRPHYLGYVLESLREMVQWLYELSCLVRQGVFTCRENDFYVLGFLVDLMDKKRVDNVLGNELVLVPVVHEPRQVPVNLVSELYFVRYRCVGCHLAADCYFVYFSVEVLLKTDDHIASFGHFGKQPWVFHEEVDQCALSGASQSGENDCRIVLSDGLEVSFQLFDEFFDHNILMSAHIWSDVKKNELWLICKIIKWDWKCIKRAYAILEVLFCSLFDQDVSTVFFFCYLK